MDIVDYHRVYKLNQTPTNQALRVRHGKAEKTFLMDVTSNDLFTDDEYRRWIRVMEAEKQRILSRTQLKMRKKKLEEAISHVFTSVTDNSFFYKLQINALSNLQLLLGRSR